MNTQSLIQKDKKIQTQTYTKLTLVRHAQSYLNLASHTFREQKNLPYDWSILCQHKQFLLGVKYNKQFLDCDITQTGIQQCIAARQHVKDIKPQIILVSPLYRTLRTCSLVFNEHINSGIKVVVQPLLAEAFRSSCDVPIETEKKRQLFQDYNFEPTLKEGEYWFIKNQSAQNQKKYFQLLQQHKSKTYLERINILLDFMTQSLIYQTAQNIRARAYQIKRMIEQKYSKQYKHIGIVAHYNTINFMIASKFDENNSQPVDSLRIGNCEVVQKTLQEILRYR